MAEGSSSSSAPLEPSPSSERARHLVEGWLTSKMTEVAESARQRGIMPQEGPGTLGLQLSGVGWTIGLVGGAFEVSDGLAADSLLSLETSVESFEQLVVGVVDRGLEQARSLSAANGVLFDSSRAALFKVPQGAIQLVIQDGAKTHVFRLTLGPRPSALASAEARECRVECSLEDLEALQAGKTQPMELLFSGRLKMSGDPQVVMVLAGLMTPPPFS